MSDHALWPLAAASLHHGHHDHYDGLSDLLVSNTVHSGHSAIQSDIHTASVNNMQETSDAARDSIDATNNIGNLNLASSERNGGETRSAVFKAAGLVKDQIAFNANQASRDHTRLISEICDVRKEMAVEHGDIKLEMCKQHGELARQIDARAAEAARQLAECCCDIKQLVTSENNQTRQLIQSNQLDEANRRTAEAQSELTLLKIQASINA